MTTPLKQPVRVGLDLGGTGTRAVATCDGQILASADALTAELGADSIAQRMDRLVALVRRVVPEGSTLAALGVGASGPVDVRTGTIHNHDTLTWFSGFAFVAELQQRVGVPVPIYNDAVVAALVEQSSGA